MDIVKTFLAIITKNGFPINYELCCIKLFWWGYKQNNIVNSVCVDDLIAEWAIIASDVYDVNVDDWAAELASIASNSICQFFHRLGTFLSYGFGCDDPQNHNEWYTLFTVLVMFSEW